MNSNSSDEDMGLEDASVRTCPDIQIQVCDDSKIKKELKSTRVQQELIRQAKTSQSLPPETVEMDDVLPDLGKTNKLRNKRFSPGLPTDKTRRARLTRKYKVNRNSFTPDYNNSRSIDQLLPPHTDIMHKTKHLKNMELEKQLNDVRKRFVKQRQMESQLGLTPDAGSVLVSPANEAIDIEEQVLERREELGFRRRTFWKSCCGQVIDRRATQFFVQVFIGAGVIIFCMAKIWQAVPLHGCTGEDTTVYFSLLSALVGFYIPSPSMHKQ